MRIMVLGSVTQGVDNKARDFQEFCRRLGAAARQRGHSAAVCSLFPNSADLAFLEGMAEAAPTSRGADATVFFPADTENEDRFHAVKSKIPFQLQACPVYAIQPSAGRSYAFLQCQLMALDSCDIVVAVGGNRDGSAPMLLRLAEFKRKAIVPVTAFDGAASDYYHANRVQFLRQYEVLSRRERADDIISLATPEATRPGSLNHSRVFLSYSRRNAEQADVVETVLRRHRVEPFRDEDGIKMGDDWQGKIAEELKHTDIFVALWSAEYACSPHCFDEMDAALTRSPALEIWLLALDGTPVTFPKARSLHHPPARSRKELVEALSRRLREYEVQIREGRT